MNPRHLENRTTAHVNPVLTQTFFSLPFRSAGGGKNKWQWRRVVVTDDAMLKYYDPEKVRAI
jgi:hypothetical protein